MENLDALGDKVRKVVRLIFMSLLASSCALTAGCGGGVDSNDKGNPSVPAIPDPSNPDPEATPTIPGITPTPRSQEQSAGRGSTIISETENYSITTETLTGELSFGLLESSGGSYEMEPPL